MRYGNVVMFPLGSLFGEIGSERRIPMADILAEWKGILKEMADAFRAADKNCADFVICPTEKAIAERKRAMALLDKYFDDLWN